jgi:hypothetical protein
MQPSAIASAMCYIPICWSMYLPPNPTRPLLYPHAILSRPMFLMSAMVVCMCIDTHETTLYDDVAAKHIYHKVVVHPNLRPGTKGQYQVRLGPGRKGFLVRSCIVDYLKFGETAECYETQNTACGLYCQGAHRAHDWPGMRPLLLVEQTMLLGTGSHCWLPPTANIWLHVFLTPMDFSS